MSLTNASASFRSPDSPSLASRMARLARDLRDLAYDHLELAALEAQRAGAALARMVCAAVVMSILWVSAWLALMAAAIVWATGEGVSWAGALAIAALINVAAGGLLGLWLRRQAGELMFAATLRQLRRPASPIDGGIA